MRLSEIVAVLGGELRGEDREVRALAPLDAAGPEDIGFLSDQRRAGALADCRAAALIVAPAMAPRAAGQERSLVVTDDPYVYMARLTALLHPPPAVVPGVHPSAVVGRDCRIAASSAIGATACLGDRVTIGERCRLHPGVVIGDDVTLGDDVALHSRVTVLAGTRIGHRVIVHPGAVIGSDGFGLAWAEDHWEKIPQRGRVLLGDDVEIGANTTVDRGALSDTRIGDDVRIDNLVQVAHNVQIGPHTAIAACVAIAGSTRIGARCRIGGAAMFVGHIDVADGTTIGAGTLVSKSVRTADHYAAPFPFLSHRDWRTNAVHLRHLDRLVGRVRAVEQAVRGLCGDPPDDEARARPPGRSDDDP